MTSKTQGPLDRIPDSPQGEMEKICTMGTPFSESSIALCAYSPSLSKDRVTERLCVQPTSAWNPGEPHLVGNGKNAGERVDAWGKWILSSARDSEEIEKKVLELLSLCTTDLDRWVAITGDYQVWLEICVDMSDWNHELLLSSRLLNMLAERKLELKFDAFYVGEEE